MRCRFRTNVKFAGNLQPVINISLQTYNFQEWCLISCLLLFFLIQMYFLIRYFLKTLFLKPAVESIFENHISVVVPVRNDEEEINSIIEELLSQHYTNFEIIIVDDHSVDRTYEFMFNLTKKYKKVKYTGIAQDVRFAEKMNINLGMKASRSEWIVFTDPEVKDRDQSWLKNMNDYVNEDIDVVVGYSNIKRGKGFVRYFFRIEKMWQFLHGVAYSMGGRAFIPEQDNVLIRKKIYFDKGGFRQHINKHYANLELVLNEKLKKKRMRIATSNVAVRSEVGENESLSYKTLVKKSMQIRKNLSFFSRGTMFFDEYSRIALIAAFVLMCVFTPLYWEFSLVVMFIYIMLLSIIFGINQRRLKERKLFLSSLIYILIRPLLVLFIGMAMITKDRRDRWI